MKFLDSIIINEFSPCFWVKNEFFTDSDYRIRTLQKLGCVPCFSFPDYKIRTPTKHPSCNIYIASLRTILTTLTILTPSSCFLVIVSFSYHVLIKNPIFEIFGRITPKKYTIILRQQNTNIQNKSCMLSKKTSLVNNLLLQKRK
jgi:hypothetical protein